MKIVTRLCQFVSIYQPSFSPRPNKSPSECKCRPTAYYDRSLRVTAIISAVRSKYMYFVNRARHSRRMASLESNVERECSCTVSNHLRRIDSTSLIIISLSFFHALEIKLNLFRTKLNLADSNRSLLSFSLSYVAFYLNK